MVSRAFEMDIDALLQPQSCSIFIVSALAAVSFYPVAHLFQLCCRLKSNSWRDAFKWPLAGGVRSAAFQGCGTVAWLVSVACTLVLLYGMLSSGNVLASEFLVNCEDRTVTVVAGVSGLLAAAFFVKAYLLHSQQLSFYQRRAPVLSAAVVGLLGLLLTSVASLLVVGLDGLMDRATQVVHLILALACVTVAVLSTYGAGGHVYHIMGRPAAKATWRFFQPFQGGLVFIATQSTGWTVFAGVMLALVHVLYSVTREIATHVSLRWLAAGMLVAQTVLGLSVAFYSHKDAPDTPPGTPRFKRNSIDIARRVADLADLAVPLTLIYLPAHLWTLLLVLHLMLPLRLGLSLLLATHVPYFFLTLRGSPSVTGCRTSPPVVRYIRRTLGPAFAWWMTDCRVVKAFEGELDPSRKYIFTYAPHGLLPAAAGYLMHLPSWAQSLPGIEPVVLTATVMHYVPFMRDIGGWTGFREVSREAFNRALDTVKHVIMCPGGQAELIYAAEAWDSRKRVVRMCVRHKGFIKMAIQHQAALVPMLNLGEILHFQNAGNLPWMQRFTYKRIGFPMPYLLTGWCFTPLPKRIPNITFVGQPVQPPPMAGDSPSATEVDDLHRRYYSAVRELWDQHHAEHPQYRDCQLQFDAVLT